MGASAYLKSDLDLRTTHARLEQMERGEWARWGAAMAIPLFLTAGLSVLTLGGFSRDAFAQQQLEIAVRALLGLVLLFDAFVIYQQILITRLRRQLTSQLGLIAALDLIKRPGEPEREFAPEPQPASMERRRLVRVEFDHQVKVRSTDEYGKEVTNQGRIRDMSEHGIGAVIPASFRTGDVITAEFKADGVPLALRAVVRYRRGFRYGMEFTGLTAPDAESLRRLRLKQLASGSPN